MPAAEPMSEHRRIRCSFGVSGLGVGDELAGLVEPVQDYRRLGNLDRVGARKLKDHEVLPIGRHIIR